MRDISKTVLKRLDCSDKRGTGNCQISNGVTCALIIKSN
jgi:hypothetical protein